MCELEKETWELVPFSVSPPPSEQLAQHQRKGCGSISCLHTGICMEYANIAEQIKEMHREQVMKEINVVLFSPPCMKHALWGCILLNTSLAGFVKVRKGLTIKSAFHFHKPSFINFGYSSPN